MARPLKTGLDYFPLDVDFYVDDRVIALIGEFGIKGESTFIHLLCAIYRNGYYVEWDERLRSKLDRELPCVGVGLIENIIDRLVRWGFFDKDLFNQSSILTSRGIQRRYFGAVRKRKCDSSSLPYLLISPFPEQDEIANPNPVPQSVPKASNPTTKDGSDNKSVPNHRKYQPTIIRGEDGNSKCRSIFFSPSNRGNLEMFMMNLSLRKEDFTRLEQLADVVINEWNITGTAHTDYPDWSRHLISLIRIKLQQFNKGKKPSITASPNVKESNYTFDGGFGGQDI